MRTITLNDGNKIPAVGFGVFLIPNDGPAYDAVLTARRISRYDMVMRACCPIRSFKSRLKNMERTPDRLFSVLKFRKE